MDVNVVGAFRTSRAVAPALAAAGGGCIVNISSIAARNAQGSCLPYSCSKAALDALTAGLARTLARAGAFAWAFRGIFTPGPLLIFANCQGHVSSESRPVLLKGRGYLHCSVKATRRHELRLLPRLHLDVFVVLTMSLQRSCHSCLVLRWLRE